MQHAAAQRGACYRFSLATAANGYSTNFGGGVTVEISYIDPQPGGFVVGTFMGTVVGMTGESMNIAQGAFQMEIQ